MSTTHYYPAAHAAEAARHLRELAAAGAIAATDPSTGPLLVELRDAAGAMRQVLDQLAIDHASLAHPGRLRVAARRTGDELHQAGTALEETATHLTGAIDAATELTMMPTVPTREWVPVASVRGEDAARALALLDRDRQEAAAVFLSQWDSGADTDDRAVEQQATLEQLPLEPGDQAVTVDAYTIVADPARGHIAMYRLLDDLPSPALLDAQDAITIPAPAPVTAPAPSNEPVPGSRRARREARQGRQGRHQQRRSDPDGSWFAPPAGGSNTSAGRGLGL
ncbi:hypothetical protein [Brevibacterium luteolum]|uniref:hypothetical protein n=1 Tax=Brevibacterium luteolum TaxID=199591 RepID=UPI001C23F688|nr:hypothetical protein [Brevibacterium luteolum]MBU8577599.1 hypothetical protein [Brevibacterium luteolum]